MPLPDPDLFDEAYYRTHCGPIPYDRSTPHFLDFFAGIAEMIVRELDPRTVLDVGCAKGFLVEALRDRGVESYGIDISSYAISEVREDIKPYCRVASATEPFEGIYDLIVCIETLEHMCESDALQAIRNMTSATDRILFSSSPWDRAEPTHVNVRPPQYWLRLFHEHGFGPVTDLRLPSIITPQAFVVTRQASTVSRASYAEAFGLAVRLRVDLAERQKTLRELGEQLSALQEDLKTKQVALEGKQEKLTRERETKERAIEQIRATTAIRGWRYLECIRAGRRFFTRFARGVLRRREPLILIGVIRGDRDGYWIAEGDDPQFIITGPFRRGLYTLRFHGYAESQAPSAQIQLYFGEPHAFSEPASKRYGRMAYEYENHEHVLPFDIAARAYRIRFDPLDCPGKFYISRLRVCRESVALTVLRRMLADFRQPRSILGYVQHLVRMAWSPQEREGMRRRLEAAAKQAALNPACAPPVRFSDPIPLVAPLNLVVRARSGHRFTLNVLLPGIAFKKMSAGPNTAILLGLHFAEHGIPVRFLSTDLPCDTAGAVWDHCERLVGHPLERSLVDFVSVNDRSRATDIGERNVFLATAWWTAQMAQKALHLTKSRRFMYLIQDFEPGLYPWSSLYQLACETYKFNYAAIINEGFLADYLRESRIGNFRDPSFLDRCVVFEPAIDGSLFHCHSNDRARFSRKALLFYARTHAPRNLFEFGMQALKRVVDMGLFDPEEWEFLFMGDDLAPVDLGNGIRIAYTPWLGYTDYAARLRRADIGLSLMLSPHTSYPPLEMAACGVQVVTNTYANKTASALRGISEHLIPVEPYPSQIAEGLEEACRRVREGDSAQRSAGVRLPRRWDEVFEPLTPKLLEMFDICGRDR